MAIIANSMADYGRLLGPCAAYLGLDPRVEIHRGVGTRGGDSDTDADVASLALSMRGKVCTRDRALIAMHDAICSVRTEWPGGPAFIAGEHRRDEALTARLRSILESEHTDRLTGLAAIVMASYKQEAEESHAIHPNVIVARYLESRGITNYWCTVVAASILTVIG